MFEEFKEESKEEETDAFIKRKKHQCPHCNEILQASYIEQNPFLEIPCPSCGSLIETTSIEEVEIQSENERANERYDAPLKVVYQSFDKFITEYTKDVSKGGMFINTKTDHDIGSHVELFLYVPGLEKPIKLTGEVIHANSVKDEGEDTGIGVNFIDIDDGSRQILINFMKSQESSN